MQTLHHGYSFWSGLGCWRSFEPASLLAFWKILKAAVAADCIVICQAANTGVTGGSTPDGDDYDREIVIISTLQT